MEEVSEITSLFGDEMKLAFNPTKSAIGVFYKSENKEKHLCARDQEIQKDTLYEYLGITISDSGSCPDRP